jgi:hypothetical protein
MREFNVDRKMRARAARKLAQPRRYFDANYRKIWMREVVDGSSTTAAHKIAKIKIQTQIAKVD